MTANPATACAVLVRVFTDTLTVVCLRGLSPFLPTPRGSPVTIEPHMRNASAFPRPVQSNRTTRDNSVIARGKAVFNSCSFRLVKYNARPPPIGGKAAHSSPPAPYRGQSGTSRKVAVHLSNFTPDAVRTSRYKGRAPRPIRWTPSLSPVRGLCPCPVDSAYYTRYTHSCQ